MLAQRQGNPQLPRPWTVEKIRQPLRQIKRVHPIKTIRRVPEFGRGVGVNFSAVFNRLQQRAAPSFERVVNIDLSKNPNAAMNLCHVLGNRDERDPVAGAKAWYLGLSRGHGLHSVGQGWPWRGWTRAGALFSLTGMRVDASHMPAQIERSVIVDVNFRDSFPAL